MRDRIGTALNGDHRFRRLNPGLEFDYRLSQGLNLRVGYAQSNRAPTPAELSCADENAPCSLANFFIADPPLKQVVAKSWEARSEEHTSELQSLMRISYAVFCLKKKNTYSKTKTDKRQLTD